MMHDVLEDESIQVRPTTAWVDLDALRANVAAVRARVGARRIMGIVKANAYGHGLVRTSKELLRFGCDELGVAFLEEGIALRRAGIEAPILVLGGIIGHQISHFLEYDLQLTASSIFKLSQIEAAAEASGRRAKVHLKIDTGMERIGIHWDNAATLIEAALAADHCELAGVFSHLACSDAADPSFTRRQLERFEEALSVFERRSEPMPLRHIANSGAVLQHPEALYDMVRPGCLLYGFYPSQGVQRTVDVTPVLSLRSQIVYFKVVRAGSSVSYDRLWIAPNDTRVVTVPAGYGDGYPRRLTGKGEVLIHGRRYPVVGAVTMDALMVDIGADSAFNGDEVVLLGSQGSLTIRAEELAEALGTIPYEVLTSIAARVPRRYIPTTT